MIRTPVVPALDDLRRQAPALPLLDQLLALWRRTSRKDRTLFLKLVGKART